MVRGRGQGPRHGLRFGSMLVPYACVLHARLATSCRPRSATSPALLVAQNELQAWWAWWSLRRAMTWTAPSGEPSGSAASASVSPLLQHGSLHQDSWAIFAAAATLRCIPLHLGHGPFLPPYLLSLRFGYDRVLDFPCFSFPPAASWTTPSSATPLTAPTCGWWRTGTAAAEVRCAGAHIGF